MLNISRLLDVVVSIVGLLLMLPLLTIVTLAIWVSDGRPILFVANRAGKDAVPIKVHKFRTMHIDNEKSSRITSANDDRIFPMGSFLRKTKLDEFLQLWDVLRGRLAIVGPRPEDLSIVKQYYIGNHFYEELLKVRPGLISPGTLYYYSYLENSIPETNAEKYYFNVLLPAKSALDIVYLRNRSMMYDIRLIVRAVIEISAKLIGIELSRKPPEYQAAQRVLYDEYGFEKGVL